MYAESDGDCATHVERGMNCSQSVELVSKLYCNFYTSYYFILCVFTRRCGRFANISLLLRACFVQFDSLPQATIYHIITCTTLRSLSWVDEIAITGSSI